MGCGMSNNEEFKGLTESEKRIQVVFYNPRDEQERVALRTLVDRRKRGEQVRDIISYALWSISEDDSPAHVDASTGEWLIGVLREENEAMINQIRAMLTNIRTIADDRGMVSVKAIEAEMSEFEKNARNSASNRRTSIDL